MKISIITILLLVNSIWTAEVQCNKFFDWTCLNEKQVQEQNEALKIQKEKYEKHMDKIYAEIDKNNLIINK